MRIGLGLDTAGTVDDVVERARGLAATGVATLWSSQIFGWDTLTTLAVVGREVPSVGLGTAVVPVYPRHPAMLAAQALTVQSASGGRLLLGVGLSHQLVVEGMWGLSFERPVQYMREYLSILQPMLNGEKVALEGELLKTTTFAPPETPGAVAPPVLVAALGPSMLRVAAQLAAGTVTWMVGLRTLAEHVAPTIREAAREAGRSDPQIVVHLPVCVTSDREEALERAGRVFSVYGQLPSYRAMLDREGAANPPDVAIVGTEEDVAAQIRRFEDAGATEFCVVAFGKPAEISLTNNLAGALVSR